MAAADAKATISVASAYRIETDRRLPSMHLWKAFEYNELDETTTPNDFLVVQTEGRRRVCRQTKRYNLDAIISSATASTRAAASASDNGHGLVDIIDRYTLSLAPALGRGGGWSSLTRARSVEDVGSHRCSISPAPKRRWSSCARKCATTSISTRC